MSYRRFPVRLFLTSYKKAISSLVAKRNLTLQRTIHDNSQQRDTNYELIQSDHPVTLQDLKECFKVVPECVTGEEEAILLAEIEPYLSKLKYEFDHWDDAIHGYRETEKKHWRKPSKEILDRIKKQFIPSDVRLMPYVHVLDLAEDGYIKPHVDSKRFCGNCIVGISLLSASVMRLSLEDKPSLSADVLLLPRSLYIMTDNARSLYTHEILSGKESVFNGKEVKRERRISIIFRNEAE